MKTPTWTWRQVGSRVRLIEIAPAAFNGADVHLVRLELSAEQAACVLDATEALMRHTEAALAHACQKQSA